MATTGKILYQGQPANTDTLLYSPAAGLIAYVDQAVVCNPTGGAETIDVSVVDGGGAATAANQIYDALSIAASETKVLSALVNARLEDADQLRATASAATSLTVTIWGREVTTS